MDNDRQYAICRYTSIFYVHEEVRHYLLRDFFLFSFFANILNLHIFWTFTSQISLLHPLLVLNFRFSTLTTPNSLLEFHTSTFCVVWQQYRTQNTVIFLSEALYKIFLVVE